MTQPSAETPFADELVIDQMDPLDEADTVAAILQRHGLDPERHLYRGAAMPESVRGVYANGHDYPVEVFDGTVWAMGMVRAAGRMAYSGACAEDQGLTPLSYVKGLAHPGVIAVYRRDDMSHVGSMDKWAFDKGVEPRAALAGIILAVTSQHLSGKRLPKVERLRSLIRGQAE